LINQLGLVSLFCGPGGLDEGFKQEGFCTRLAYDIDSSCVETHRANHPDSQACIRDLSTISVEEVLSDWRARSDAPPVGVVGGPPCQSFSISNVHQTEDDPRHHLPQHYARILEGLNEDYEVDFFVFENVPGLVTRRQRQRFARFKGLFQRAGFRVFEGSLDAKDFGVAQVRPRVFVVGINQRKYPNLAFQFPKPCVKKVATVKDAIGHLGEPVYYARSRGLSPDDIPEHPNHWCMTPKSRKFTNGTLSPGDVWGRSFRVLSWDQPSYTVAYGHREVHVHPNCKRRLSVYEAMLLQGFPKDYVLKGTLSAQIRLVSEAVSPPVAAALARELRRQLGLASSACPATAAGTKSREGRLNTDRPAACKSRR